MRRRHPWLYRAQTEMLHLAGEQMIYRVAAPAADPGNGGEQHLVVALSLADEEVRHGVPGAREILAGPGRWPAPGAPGARVILPAHGWAVLS